MLLEEFILNLEPVCRPSTLRLARSTPSRRAQMGQPRVLSLCCLHAMCTPFKILHL